MDSDLRQRLRAILAADVAGYSRLMADDERATIAAIEAARRVFRQHVEAGAGRVVDTAGDSVLAIFETAAGAADAALAIQQQLDAEGTGLPEQRRMRFRIGIHLGDVVERGDGGAYGNGVNIAARLQALAAPGDIWVSEAVHGTLGERAGRRFVDQGRHAVKNIVEPVHAYLLHARDAAAPAPAAPRPGTLPLNPNALIGRERDLAAVVELLATTRLLTLVGAGGVGKTRFALELAATVAADHPDGTWFVELAPLADPALVPRTVAAALDLHEEPGRPLSDTLLDFLRRRRLLLVLDNCEHLVEACARWTAQVLQACAGVRVLATSREALDIDGEVAWRVPSLRTAAPDADVSAEQLMRYPASQLFVQRASAAAPTFRLGAQNAAAVAAICHRLDGIPLALELAAARVKAMRVEQVAERLHDRFALLVRGSRTVLQRHQTLRSLIDWSHDLLPEPERVLLRRLSVFAGGWTLETAEAVCSGDDMPVGDVLDRLSSLVEKSLVLFDDAADEARYRMLETIRQYGQEKLRAAGEAERLQQRHLRHYADFAESLRSVLIEDDENHRLLERAEAELDNLRIALAASLEQGQPILGLQLINSLHRYWYHAMHWKEIVGWTERLGQAADRDGAPGVDRARSLYVAAMLATNYDPQLGRSLGEQCLQTSRTIGFDEGMACALAWIGYIDTRRRDAATAELFEESLRIGRRVEDPWRRSIVLVQTFTCYAGYAALMGRDDAVETFVHACEAELDAAHMGRLYRGHCKALLGIMATRRGQYERAAALLAESLAHYEAIESKFDIAGSLAQQGFLALRQGDARRGLELFRRSLPPHRHYPNSPWVTRGLAQVLVACAACEDWPTTATLAGVLGSSASQAPPELSGFAAKAYGEAIAQARAAMGAPAFEEACDAGRRMTREQAVELALTTQPAR